MQLIEGLRRSARQPDELIIVDMSDEPVALPSVHFPVCIDRFAAAGLPLAAARNRAAAMASHDMLVFLDVDCIPLHDCIGTLAKTLEGYNALLCADVRYLGPADVQRSWKEADLLRSGRTHPARPFPRKGIREEPNFGLFWSLAFAMWRQRFNELTGFDEAFSGYGAEDTDFGFRADAIGLKLLFVGGAIACHQYHDSYEPPVQHVADIVRNARQFHARWNRWPMEGWLAAFRELGLVYWRDDALDLVRLPTIAETIASRVEPSDWQTRHEGAAGQTGRA